MFLQRSLADLSATPSEARQLVGQRPCDDSESQAPALRRRPSIRRSRPPLPARSAVHPRTPCASGGTGYRTLACCKLGCASVARQAHIALRAVPAKASAPCSYSRKRAQIPGSGRARLGSVGALGSAPRRLRMEHFMARKVVAVGIGLVIVGLASPSWAADVGRALRRGELGLRGGF